MLRSSRRKDPRSGPRRSSRWLKGPSKRSPAIAHRRGRRVPRRGHPRGHQGPAAVRRGLCGRLPGFAHLAPDGRWPTPTRSCRNSAHFGPALRKPPPPPRWRPRSCIRSVAPSPGNPRSAPRRLGRAGQPGIRRRHRRRAGDRGRGLRRRLVHHAGTLARVRHEIADLAAGPAPQSGKHGQGVEDGFSLSEASKTPVMLQLRIRGCHVHGRFIARKTSAPPSAWRRRWKARRATPAASCCRPRPSCTSRKRSGPLARRHPLYQGTQAQRAFRRRPVRHRPDPAGRPAQRRVIRALQLLGLADHFGNSRIPLYVMNVTPPVIEDEVIDFCRDKRAVLLLEEGQPDYIEQNLHAVLRKAGIARSSRARTCCPWPASTPPRSCARGPARIPAPQPPRIAADASGRGRRRSRRQRRPARDRRDRARAARQTRRAAHHLPQACRGADGGSAAAPGRLLYRLPRAPDLLGADAGAGNAGPAPYFLRHRLPPVLDPAALQPGRHHHGLRPGRVQRGGLQCAGGQAPDLHHGDGGFCTTACLGHRQRRVQQVRRRHRHRRQLLRVGHRRQDILSSRAENPPDRSTNNRRACAAWACNGCARWIAPTTWPRCAPPSRKRSPPTSRAPRSSSRSPSAC